MERIINFNDCISRYKIISKSGGGSNIKCSIIDNTNVILKKFSSTKKYRYSREKEIYLKLLDACYIPKLIYFDDTHRILAIEDVGDSIRKTVLNNQINRIPKNLLHQLEVIIRDMYDKYSLIHGDLHLANVCVKNNKLYLIDLETSIEMNIESCYNYDYTNKLYESKNHIESWQSDSHIRKQVLQLTDSSYLRTFINSELINTRPWESRLVDHFKRIKL